MKYFKYRAGKVGRMALRARVAALSRENKRRYYIRKTISVANMALLIVMVFAFSLLCWYVNGLHNINSGLRIFLFILSVIATMIVPIAICVFLVGALYKFLPYVSLPKITKSAVAQCTQPLRKYYKLTDNYIVTKCYECSDDNFTDKDVIIFVYGGDLRIINDINSSIRDCGCYSMPLAQLSCGYVQMGKLMAAKIECGSVTFVLGKRAKPFVFKCMKNAEGQ